MKLQQPCLTHVFGMITVWGMMLLQMRIGIVSDLWFNLPLIHQRFMMIVNTLTRFNIYEYLMLATLNYWYHIPISHLLFYYRYIWRSLTDLRCIVSLAFFLLIYVEKHFCSFYVYLKNNENNSIFPCFKLSINE